MDFSRNKKYFFQREDSWQVVLGAILIAAGFIMTVFLGFTKNLPQALFQALGLVSMLAGAIVFIVRSNVKVKDSDIDDAVASLDESFRDAFELKFVRPEMRVQRLANELEHGDIFYYGTYIFDGEDTLSRRGSDGRSRSSLYSFSAFMLLHNKLCAAKRRICIVENEPFEDEFVSLKYTAMSEVKLVEADATGYKGTTPYEHMIVYGNNGEILLEIPMLADAEAEDSVAVLNTRIAHAKGLI